MCSIGGRGGKFRGSMIRILAEGENELSLRNQNPLEASNDVYCLNCMFCLLMAMFVVDTPRADPER